MLYERDVIILHKNEKLTGKENFETGSLGREEELEQQEKTDRDFVIRLLLDARLRTS